MVGSNPVHINGLGANSAKDVTATDDDAEFYPKRVYFGNFVSNVEHYIGVNTEAHFPHHGFAREFDEYSLIFRRVVHRDSLTALRNLRTRLANCEANKATNENILSKAVDSIA